MDLYLNQFYVSILNIKLSCEKSEVNIIVSMGNSAFTITISMVKIMKNCGLVVFQNETELNMTINKISLVIPEKETVIYYLINDLYETGWSFSSS